MRHILLTLIILHTPLISLLFSPLLGRGAGGEAFAQDAPTPSTPLIEQPAPEQPDLSLLAEGEEENATAAPAIAELTYGYLSYNDVLTAMPAYQQAQTQINALRQAYQQELNHNQEAFSKAYYEYIEGQQDFDQYILLKRQKELEQQLNNNEAFKQQALTLLAEKEAEILAPLHKQLTDIINQIGLERNYAFILNTDNQAYLFLNGAIGTDITADVVMRIENTK